MSIPPIDIVLHAGAHKTASSHMQLMLGRQKVALKDHGIGYWGPSDLRKMQGGLRGLMGLDGQAEQGQFEACLEGFDRVVFSEENFLGKIFNSQNRTLYPQATAAITRFVERCAPHPVHLAFAIRNPSAFLVSAYGQSLVGGRIKPWAEFVENSAWWKYRWTRLLRPIVQTAGCASVTVWRYEDYGDLSEIISGILLGEDHPPVPFQKSEQVNAGLSEAAVKHCLQWYADGREGNLAKLARDEFPVSAEFPKFNPWSGYDKGYATACYDKDVLDLDDMDGLVVL